MVLPLVTHVPGPTWRVVESEVWAMAGGKSTYLREREREGEGGGERLGGSMCGQGGGQRTTH